MITYGALFLHDSRVSEDDNIAFLDLLEDYFAQPEALLKQDERPDLGYQVNPTPSTLCLWLTYSTGWRYIREH